MIEKGIPLGLGNSEQRPCFRIIGIKFNGATGKPDQVVQTLNALFVSEGERAKKRVIGFGVFRPRNCDIAFLAPSQLHLKGCRNFLRDVTFNLKNIDQFAVISLRPDMRIIERIHKLD